ncbi:aminotransferase class IV [Verrucomicrobiota bacterium]
MSSSFRAAPKAILFPSRTSGYCTVGMQGHIQFDLLETLLLEAGRGYFLLDLHLERLGRSADHFDFPLDLEAIRESLCRTAPAASGDCKVRLLVSRSGEVRTEIRPLVGTGDHTVWRVAISDRPVDACDPFLYHKTTNRRVYEEALARRPEAQDVLLWNEAGEMTETCNANVVVERGGRLITPPVSCGLLPGTFRAHLLEQGSIDEGVVTLDEAREAGSIRLINSVRKWIECRLLEPWPATP